MEQAAAVELAAIPAVWLPPNVLHHSPFGTRLWQSFCAGLSLLKRWKEARTKAGKDASKASLGRQAGLGGHIGCMAHQLASQLCCEVQARHCKAYGWLPCTQ